MPMSSMWKLGDAHGTCGMFDSLVCGHCVVADGSGTCDILHVSTDFAAATRKAAPGFFAELKALLLMAPTPVPRTPRVTGGSHETQRILP